MATAKEIPVKIEQDNDGEPLIVTARTLQLNPRATEIANFLRKPNEPRHSEGALIKILELTAGGRYLTQVGQTKMLIDPEEDDYFL